jgi:hypothetical protein
MQYLFVGVFCFLLGDAIGVEGVMNIGHKIMGLF